MWLELIPGDAAARRPDAPHGRRRPVGDRATTLFTAVAGLCSLGATLRVAAGVDMLAWAGFSVHSDGELSFAHPPVRSVPGRPGPGGRGGAAPLAGVGGRFRGGTGNCPRPCHVPIPVTEFHE